MTLKYREHAFEIAVGMSYRRFESVIFASSPCVESPNGYVATAYRMIALELTAPWMHWRLDRRALTVNWSDGVVSLLVLKPTLSARCLVIPGSWASCGPCRA